MILVEKKLARIEELKAMLKLGVVFTGNSFNDTPRKVVAVGDDFITESRVYYSWFGNKESVSSGSWDRSFSDLATDGSIHIYNS